MSKSISKKVATAATSNPYTIVEHSKRFEKWVKKKCKCPPVTQSSFRPHDHVCAALLAANAARGQSTTLNGVFAKKVLDFGSNPKITLPSQDDFEQWHEDRIKEILAQAKINKIVKNNKKSKGIPLSYGTAAKLLNVYLKARYIVGQSNPSDYIHPPIDSILLNELTKQDVGGFKEDWSRFAKIRWSKFESQDYKDAIAKIREALNGQPLWKIEEYWES